MQQSPLIMVPNNHNAKVALRSTNNAFDDDKQSWIVNIYNVSCQCVGVGPHIVLIGFNIKCCHLLFATKFI